MKHSLTQKVTRRYQMRRYGYVAVPEIRLAGKWLKTLGFETGRQFVITQENNMLVIQVIIEGNPQA